MSKPRNLSKQLRCDVCGDPAMVSILKDAFGKSDQTGNFCAVHAPKHSAIHPFEAPLTSKKEIPTFSGRLYTYEHERGLAGSWVRRAEVDSLLDEIERLRAENEALRNLAENLRPGPISEALAGSSVETKGDAP